eukprot:NODE_217_length_14216_cov_0.430545.p6 type:complete len:249 gc:universal NODE_217_length_14216_cov_0.430545:12763-13509(+)
MLFVNSLASAACSTLYQKDLSDPNVPSLFTNDSILFEIASDSLTYWIELISNAQPNGKLTYNLNQTVDTSNLPTWIVFDAKVASLGANDTKPSDNIPKFEVAITARYGPGNSYVTSVVSSMAYANLTSNEWSTLKISTKDIAVGTQISQIAFQKIDASELYIKSIKIETQDCTARNALVLQDFRTSAYNLRKVSYLNHLIAPSSLSTLDANGLQFKGAGSGSVAANRFRLNPQCKLPFTGISFTGTYF